MISKEDIKHFEKIFPFWLNISQNDRARIILSSRILSLKENAIFFNSHDLDGLLFLKSGKLRFFLSHLEARELPLYYLNNMEVEFFENFTDNSISMILDIAFIVENILLKPLKERLLNFLYSLNKTEISLTHEEIAKNLGSSREVISRNLKILEKENFLKINRKKIIILDRGEVL